MNISNELEQIKRRYPRLVTRLMIANILSLGEATACIRDHQNSVTFSSEAVMNAGGPRSCIRHAIRVRGLARPEVIRTLLGGRLALDIDFTHPSPQREAVVDGLMVDLAKDGAR